MSFVPSAVPVLKAIEDAKQAAAAKTVECAEKGDYRSVKSWADVTTNLSALLSHAADILAGER